MEKQEIFNIVATKLLEQGKPCSVNGICRYRYNEMRCAVGHLLNDDQLDQIIGLQGETVNALITYKGNVVPAYFHVEKIFLRALQTAHDVPARVDSNPDTWLESWKTYMQHIASEYKLDASLVT